MKTSIHLLPLPGAILFILLSSIPPAFSQTSQPANPQPNSTQPNSTQPNSTQPNSNSTRNLNSLDPDPNPLETPDRPQEAAIQTVRSLTLEEAIALALRNNLDIRRAQQELTRARAGLREARAANFPSLSAGVNLTRQSSEQAVATPSTNQSGQVTTEIERQTTTNNALGGTVEANYALFTSGQRSASIRVAEGQVRAQELQIDVQTRQIAEDVTNAYYSLQEADENVRIYRDTLTQAQQNLSDAQALEQAGIGTRFDILRAQVDVSNAQQTLTERLSQQEIARRTIRQILNVANTVNVTAADPIERAGDWTLTLAESIVQAFANRSELQQQLEQREINRQQRRAQLAQLGPQVSVFASYGLNNNLDRDVGFLSNTQVGARISLNLFDGGATLARADQSEADIAIAETDYANQRNQIRLQVEQAFLNLQATRNQIESTTVNVAQATEALRLARLRFQAGVGTQLDVLSAQTELTTAEVSRLTAILGYNRSIAALQRAVANTQ